MKKIMFLLALVNCIFMVSCSDPPLEPLGEKMEFSAPDMSDEEQHSSHMPEGFNCDACTVISYQMDAALRKAEERISGKKLKESDYLDVLETVCGVKTWENYGLKSVNGVNRISGKGLETDGIPGMMYGGGKWPGRLANKCFSTIGELGEDEIYEAFRETGDLKKFMCAEASSDCANKKKTKSKEKKEL